MNSTLVRVKKLYELKRLIVYHVDALWYGSELVFNPHLLKSFQTKIHSELECRRLHNNQANERTFFGILLIETVEDTVT